MVLAYQVLARKYRPSTLSGLIGQEVLAQTLKNAFALNRIAHAFMLTGVRGVGKTTTARIIAKSLNCIGVDGKGEPTLEPCGVCTNCVSITNGSHLDVQELDAASRTGVDDMREIIENVQYKPVMARYKVYIIDEVHMLSKSAFNSLLKTLEEPPAHVKFIFATTEIRKVPITVLSRCQKFDLKRVSITELKNHLETICKQENIKSEEGALFSIARASGGSVRDSLSLLDQAISLTDGNITEEATLSMLGQSDKTILYQLFTNLMEGNTKETFNKVDEMISRGLEASVVAEDLAELCHQITLFKMLPDSINDITLTELERKEGVELSKKLSVKELTRIWQIIVKGITEIRYATNTKQAIDMLMVRILYASNLPTPLELVQKYRESNVETKPIPKNNETETVKQEIKAEPKPKAEKTTAPKTEEENLLGDGFTLEEVKDSVN